LRWIASLLGDAHLTLTDRVFADVAVIIIIADGVRPDTLGAALEPRAERGPTAPAIARLRDEGAFCTVSSCFPSVTGPAYAPFLMGRYPGGVGLPGLRWFDRSRATCSFPTFARSYVGHQMRRVDRDLDPSAPTLFELSERSVGALSVISRGLAPGGRVATFGMQNLTALRSAARVARTHFSGNVRGWLDIDRDIGDEVVRRVREERPDFVFAALTGIDKTSHAEGHDAPIVGDAIGIVDDVVARLRDDAERFGYWDDLHIWITSDHGHSPVLAHDDLARGVADLGLRVMAHPFLLTLAPQVAVMVSGNAMAHVYVELERRRRPFWSALQPRWESFVSTLAGRESIDLLLLPNERHCEVRSRARGTAIVSAEGSRFSYRRVDGDPLGLRADVQRVDEREAYDATIDSDYPDAIVQIATIAHAPRSGDIILSAAREWDFRARYEPIPHVSSHGALHREHMLVPLVMNRAPACAPRRTVDVMPSALAALGIEAPAGLDGTSFVEQARESCAA
jgi:arylsulfatase A-like enzyme